MKSSIIIICFFFLACAMGSSMNAKNDQETRILALLNRTETAEDLEDTIHSNKDFLEAINLMLNEAEEKKMGKEELMNYYLSLLKKVEWKKWIPYLRPERVAYGIYLVSIGSAAVTQPSSLYLFYNSSRLLIDRRIGGGAIEILNFELKGNRLEVVYRPEPGSTAIITETAYIEKHCDNWDVIKKITKKEHP